MPAAQMIAQVVQLDGKMGDLMLESNDGQKAEQPVHAVMAAKECAYKQEYIDQK
ncbi:hypothetical protein [Paenibacillus campi]|uniref:hypothetical protein n=1 Tax=Paenibacillus campi TaxID=3106031 RepID=UPI002AFE6E9C|nr:hypothetical protein [Paenibacillus sp. SGZ-1014]